MLIKKTKSAKETQLFAKEFLNSLKSNLVCLYGPLGSGKTTFVQGLAKALGVKKQIISPTFILIKEYKIKPSLLQPKAGPPLVDITHYSLLTHIDCYRLNSEKDIRSIDLTELWFNPENLVVIEWAEKIKKILPKKRVDIKFEYINENKRRIKIDFIN